MRKFFISLGFIILSAIGGRWADAATLYFLPSAGVSVDTDSFVVEVRLDTEGESVNALEWSVVYPAQEVGISDIFDGGSLFSLWPQRPEAKDGRIDFVAGAPGGFKGDGKLFSIILKPKSRGEAVFSGKIALGWDTSSKILLNDGLGTEAAKRFLDGAYEIFSAGEEAVKIISADHPDQNAWYTGSVLTLEWNVKSGFLYSYVLSRDPLAEPDNEAETVFEEGVEYAGLADGIYYFYLKQKSLTGNWGQKSTFRAMIDSTPPKITEAEVGRDPAVFDGRYFLSFSTRDAASGVAEVSVAEGDEAGGVWHKTVSPYLLEDQKRKSDIKVKARDKAGNEIIYALPALGRQPVRKQWVLLFLGVAILVSLVWRRRARRKV